MKKLIRVYALSLVLGCLKFIIVYGNDSTVFKINWGGFIKNDFFVDTRKNLEAVDGLFLFYPLPPKFDIQGNDLHEKYSANLISLSSRLWLTATGVKFLGAKATGHIEFDFTNFTTIAGVRFRHAYSRLDWKNSSLLFGLYWHPLFTTDVFPTVMSLNTGAPFQVFNRSPQIRFSHKTGNMRIIATALYQADYKSNGPNGSSSEYLKNAIFPNINMILQYEGENWILGITGDYKIIQPLVYTSPLVGPNTDDFIKTDEKLESYAANLYLKFSKNKFTFKTKAMYGQNLFEHLLPGGYAVATIDSLTGYRTYSSYNHLFFWANMIYGKKFQFGLFTGYFKNLGTSNSIVGPVYARGEDIDYAWRISPFISYNAPKISLSLEAETTSAAYGVIDYTAKAKVINSEETAGTRFTFSVMYHF
jgi:hypothetical protein